MTHRHTLAEGTRARKALEALEEAAPAGLTARQCAVAAGEVPGRVAVSAYGVLLRAAEAEGLVVREATVRYKGCPPAGSYRITVAGRRRLAQARDSKSAPGWQSPGIPWWAQEAARRYRAGASLEELGRVFSVSSKQVRRVLEATGVTLRDPVEAIRLARAQRARHRQGHGGPRPAGPEEGHA